MVFVTPTEPSSVESIAALLEVVNHQLIQTRADGAGWIVCIAISRLPLRDERPTLSGDHCPPFRPNVWVATRPDTESGRMFDVTVVAEVARRRGGPPPE